jgi:hypothetical protein
VRTRTLLRPAIAGLGIAGAAVAAFALPAGAAVSVQSSSPPVISVKLGKATIAANGAVIFSSSKVTCPRGATATLEVSVTEAVGNNIASGYATTPVTCTGTVQNATIAVSPTNHPFRKGSAWGDAFIGYCNQIRCLSAEDQRVIQIVG